MKYSNFRGLFWLLLALVLAISSAFAGEPRHVAVVDCRNEVLDPERLEFYTSPLSIAQDAVYPEPLTILLWGKCYGSSLLAILQDMTIIGMDDEAYMEYTLMYGSHVELRNVRFQYAVAAQSGKLEIYSSHGQLVVASRGAALKLRNTIVDEGVIDVEVP